MSTALLQVNLEGQRSLCPEDSAWNPWSLNRSILPYMVFSRNPNQGVLAMCPLAYMFI